MQLTCQTRQFFAIPVQLLAVKWFGTPNAPNLVMIELLKIFGKIFAACMIFFMGFAAIWWASTEQTNALVAFSTISGVVAAWCTLLFWFGDRHF